MNFIKVIIDFILGLFQTKSTANTPSNPAPPLVQPTAPVIVQPAQVGIGLDYHFSPHFDFGTLTKTEHREWIMKNREEAKKHLDALGKLSIQILEPVYSLMGRITITSCFRCVELNNIIGGSKTSQHCDGEAGDTEYDGIPLKEAFNKIMASNIQYGQLIFEFESWVHISIIDEILHPGKKMQKFIATSELQPDGSHKTVYTPVTKPL